MKKIALTALFVSLLSGCGSPRYTTRPIESNINNITVAIINDNETRPGFQKAMRLWLETHNYSYQVLPDGSQYDLDKLTLEYVGYWGWDLALYLKNAEIDAFYNGQKVGEVKFKVPYTANLNKFGDAKERIGYMMAALFGQLTAEEATNKAISTSGKKAKIK